jgi:hypothetical protein
MYKISRNGVILGEYDQKVVSQYIAAGSLSPDDYGWMQGMSEWKKLSELGFMPPPIPPRPAPSVASSVPAPAPPQPAAQTTKPGHTFASVTWVIVAILMPYIGCWRIIFDKSLGYASSTKTIFGVWLAAFAIIFAASNSRSSIGSTYVEAPKKISDNDIKRWAEQLIRNRMKAPSTTRFSEWKDTYTEKITEKGDQKYFWANGWVESQNSFGAMLRDDYQICFSVTDENIISHMIKIGDSQRIGDYPEACQEWLKKHK